MSTIDENEYKRLRLLNDTYEEARKRVCKSPCATTAEEMKLLPTPPANEERSKIEVFEFFHERPERYFAYVKGVKYARQDNLRRNPPHVTDWRGASITTWTGDKLGDITGVGDIHESNMGDVRIPITVKAITGVEYHGTYYASAGDYCRLKGKRVRVAK